MTSFSKSDVPLEALQTRKAHSIHNRDAATGLQTRLVDYANEFQVGMNDPAAGRALTQFADGIRQAHGAATQTVDPDLGAKRPEVGTVVAQNQAATRKFDTLKL